MIKLHVLRLKNFPIFLQLQLEEALLRADDRNWCLINEGSSPAVVLGISSKPEQMLHAQFLQEKPLPVIRRFSGGGTVVVDQNTIFTTFIINQDDIQIPRCPSKIMQWTESIYKGVFEGLDFKLKENDYVLGNKKFGGNAQHLCKNRWLHHSTLLWDFDKYKMDYLLFPPKTPAYREKRHHDEFLCLLKDHFEEKAAIQKRLLRELSHCFEKVDVTLDSITPILEKPHRKATTIL